MTSSNESPSAVIQSLGGMLLKDKNPFPLCVGGSALIVVKSNPKTNPKTPNSFRRIELGENGSAFWGRTEEALEAWLRGMAGGMRAS